MIYTMIKGKRKYQTDDSEIVDEIGNQFDKIEQEIDQDCDAIWLEYDSFGNICKY